MTKTKNSEETPPFAMVLEEKEGDLELSEEKEIEVFRICITESGKLRIDMDPNVSVFERLGYLSVARAILEKEVV